MSKLLEKAQKPIGFITIGVVVLFSLHPVWLHDRIPLRIYKPIELLSMVLLFSTLIMVSWNYFKDRDTGKVPPWLITTLLAVGLIAGGYFWKGNPLSYFSQSEVVVKKISFFEWVTYLKKTIKAGSATLENNNKTTPTELTQATIDSAKNAILTKEQQEEAKLADLKKKLVEKKELFKKDSTEKAEAADRQCKRDKQYEQLSIEIEKVEKALQDLAKQPIIPNCGDQISTPEKETTRIASTKSDDRKNEKKLKNKNVGSTFKDVVASGEL